MLRAFHKLLEISQKVAQKKSKAVFCNERCSKKHFLVFLSSFIWPNATVSKLFNKSKISKQFCAILWHNQSILIPY